MYKFTMNENTEQNIGEETPEPTKSMPQLIDDALLIVYEAMDQVKKCPLTFEQFKYTFYTVPEARMIIQAFAMKMLMQSALEEELENLGLEK
jgi:hypothetical protein